MIKIKNTNESQVGIVTGLFVLIKNRSPTRSRILDPVWDLEVRGVAEDSLDGSESVQDFGNGDRNGTREGVFIGNPLLGEAVLHLFRSEEGEASIGTILKSGYY